MITLLSFIVMGFAFSIMLRRQRRMNFLYTAQQKQATEQLEASLGDVKKLSGIIPICRSCSDILDQSGAWQSPDAFIAEHSKAEFSHGICPTCAERTENQ